MARPEKYTDEQIIAALRETKGLIYLASRRIGCSPDTIFRRSNSRAAVRDVIRHERGALVDTAEAKLFGAIMRDEPWAIQMTLKCLGKDRGYVERSEVQQVSDDDINRAIEQELARLARQVGSSTNGETR